MNLIDFYKSTKPHYPNTRDYFDVPEYPEDCVYVVFNTATHLFKIGISSNPSRRIGSIRSISGCGIYEVITLELMKGYDESARSVERALHKYYKHKKVGGEWYQLTWKDVVYVKALFYEIEGENVIDYVREFFDEWKKFVKFC